MIFVMNGHWCSYVPGRGRLTSSNTSGGNWAGGTGSASLGLRDTCHKLLHEGLRQHGGLFCSHETTAMPCVLSDESPTNGHLSPTLRFRQLASLEALGDLVHLEPRQLGAA